MITMYIGPEGCYDSKHSTYTNAYGRVAIPFDVKRQAMKAIRVTDIHPMYEEICAWGEAEIARQRKALEDAVEKIAADAESLIG